MAIGLPLGSPSPSSDGGGMAWLRRFMEGVEKRKLRVDFLAVHWYRSANPDELESWLEGLYREYRRPIWLTEFNAQYSGGDRERFARSAFRMLDRKKFVHRYAYFTPHPGEPASLFTTDVGGDLTPLGKDYAKQ